VYVEDRGEKWEGQVQEERWKFTKRVERDAAVEPQRLKRVRAFLAALRSGKFHQTQGVLHRPDDERRTAGTVGHCCLGVACEVAISGGLTLDRIVVPCNGDPRTWFGIVNPIGNDIGNKEVLPVPVIQWYSFGGPNPYVLAPREVMEKADATFGNRWTEGQLFSASSLNDDHGLSFELIADCFEYTYLREDWDAAHAAS
jgi:hypothetical protein